MRLLRRGLASRARRRRAKHPSAASTAYSGPKVDLARERVIFSYHRPGLHRGLAALSGSQTLMWSVLAYYNHSGLIAEQFQVGWPMEAAGFAATGGLFFALKMYRERSVAEITLLEGGAEMRLGFHTFAGGLRHETVALRDVDFNIRSATSASGYTFKVAGRKAYYLVDKKAETMEHAAMRWVFGPSWVPPPSK